jgi:beta-N-acetylhexosaminidase
MTAPRLLPPKVKPIILGPASEAVLLPAEADLYARHQPWGFIVFARHCQNPDQLGQFCQDLRTAVGRPDAPILIDQEGGRVQRLRPPHWPSHPPMASFGQQYLAGDAVGAVRGLEQVANEQAKMLLAAGITVNCAPVMDLPIDGADPIIGDRAFGQDPALIALLATVYAKALLAAGVTPIIKHLPGHGRALVDSHLSLPVVDTPLDILQRTDFAPFRQLCQDLAAEVAAGKIWGMTAHLLLTAVDGARPVSLSPTVIQQVIRQDIGFSGLLLSDDLEMKALQGSYGDLAVQALVAGCDAVLLCNASIDQQQETLEQLGCT